MTCEICAYDTSTDSIMWSCVGCSRKFHATCIGVTVQRGSLRKKDKKVVDINSYVLPCCEHCQELVQTKLEFNKLAEQQKNLVQQLHENTEVIHRCSLQQPNVVHDAFDGMEILMTSIRNELAEINRSSSLSGSVSAIKNHITNLLDTALTATKENLYSNLKTVAKELSTGIQNINDEICQINQLYIDTVASYSPNTSAFLGVDILDELKILSAKFSAIQTPSPSVTESHPSLEFELNNIEPDDSGWRNLGGKNVWKASWAEYDARKRRRLDQQKQAEKARRRRKRNAVQNSTMKRNDRLSNNVNKSNNKSASGSPRMTFDNRRAYPDRNCNRNTRFLPLDRELLAAAKERFSRPSPAPYSPTIKPPCCAAPVAGSSRRPVRFQSGETRNSGYLAYDDSHLIKFQRGETLNPYPADRESSRNWTTGPPAKPSVNNHCASCSCQGF